MNTIPSLKFEFTVEEANLIFTALQEMPAKFANPLSKKISETANAQIKTFEESQQQKDS